MLKLGNSCQDCGSPLGKDAYKCRCGWRMDTPSETRVASCANMPGCTKPAIIKVQIAGRWVNYCYDCQLERKTQEAEETCERLGLVTLQDKIAYCMKLGGGKFIGREPGQDDEERRAA